MSFALEAGETLGLVGESGCGKSTLGRALLRLEPIHGGRVVFAGMDLAALRGRALKTFRGQAQMIFQDPQGALNPRLAVGGMLGEAHAVHRRCRRAEQAGRVAELLRAVGLDPAYARRYPHEFSGGQRQRLGLARALAVQPRLIIADEPVSALDVSVQVQILNLLQDLQRDLNLALLFIAHDLAAVRYLCHRVLVMYLGRIVESGPAVAIYAQPRHPYTAALLAAVPDVEKGLQARRAGTPRQLLRGDVPSPADVIPGCPFHPRCPRAEARCRVEIPALREIETGRYTACHFAETL
ncbi:MAG: ABC transporter ATP-binding protein [Kiritimatiellaeota bacterium]|nr:ABC transporter ATP-binding protein [Kiritimatiellota bacterium]